MDLPTGLSANKAGEIERSLVKYGAAFLLIGIRGSIARRGSGDLARSAHGLLSSLGSFGADNARRLTEQLDAQAREENYEHTERTLAALEREAAEIHATLATFTPARV